MGWNIHCQGYDYYDYYDYYYDWFNMLEDAEAIHIHPEIPRMYCIYILHKWPLYRGDLSMSIVHTVEFDSHCISRSPFYISQMATPKWSL